MVKTRSYAGSEKCDIAGSDAVFGISDNNIYNDYMSINVNEDNQSDMRNEFSVQTPNASATDRPSEEHPTKDRHTTVEHTILDIIQEIRYQKRKVPDKNLIAQVAKNKYKLDSSVTYKTLDDMEKDDVIFVKDTGSYFIKSCRPKKAHDRNSKEDNVETALVDHDDQYERAINTDNMSNEEGLLINSRNDSFINFLDTIRTPIKDQSGTIPSPLQLDASTGKKAAMDRETSPFFNIINKLVENNNRLNEILNAERSNSSLLLKEVMELREENIRLEFDLSMHKHAVQGHPAAPVSDELTERNKAPAPKPSAPNPQEKEAAIDNLNNQLKKVLIEKHMQYQKFKSAIANSVMMASGNSWDKNNGYNF